MKRGTTAAFAAAFLAAALCRGDVIIFKNGDRLTGKVEALDSGKIQITTAVAGTVTVDPKDVDTFSTEGPLRIKLKDGTWINEPIHRGEEPGSIVTAGGKQFTVDQIAVMGPSKQNWTGSILVNGLITNGNSQSQQLGVDANAQLRRHDESLNDRFTLNAGYQFGRQKDPSTGDKSTSTDNWFGQVKYDKFWTDKIYGYAVARVEHDRIASLFLRTSPGVGVGYQWIEEPNLNFNTEAGINYIYENYDPGETDNRIALRLAYHVDKALNDVVSIFHNLEYLPAFEDPGDYLLNVDAGVKAKLTTSWFTEFKAEWKRDSTPAPGSEKNDLRYILGVGWQF